MSGGRIGRPGPTRCARWRRARPDVRGDRRDQPARRAGGALPGRLEPAHGRARAGVLGRELRRRRARGGAAVPRRRVAGRGPREGPHARPDRRVPAFDVESIEGADEAVERRAAAPGRVRERRVQPALHRDRPAEHDPVALRETFSPGFLDWAPGSSARSTSAPPIARCTSTGACGSGAARSSRRRSTTPASSSAGSGPSWRSTATPTSPGPWHAGPGAVPRG